MAVPILMFDMAVGSVRSSDQYYYGLTPGGIVRVPSLSAPFPYPGTESADELVFDTTYMYWLIEELGTIRRATKDGIETTTLFSNQSGLKNLAISGRYLAWTVGPPGSPDPQIVVADLVTLKTAIVPRGHLTSLFYGFNHPGPFIALGAAHVYWAQYADATARPVVIYKYAFEELQFQP